MISPRSAAKIRDFGQVYGVRGPRMTKHRLLTDELRVRCSIPGCLEPACYFWVCEKASPLQGLDICTWCRNHVLKVYQPSTNHVWMSESVLIDILIVMEIMES